MKHVHALQRNLHLASSVLIRFEIRLRIVVGCALF
jgi:hypothetical protein